MLGGLPVPSHNPAAAAWLRPAPGSGLAEPLPRGRLALQLGAHLTSLADLPLQALPPLTPAVRWGSPPVARKGATELTFQPGSGLNSSWWEEGRVSVSPSRPGSRDVGRAQGAGVPGTT